MVSISSYSYLLPDRCNWKVNKISFNWQETVWLVAACYQWQFVCPQDLGMDFQDVVVCKTSACQGIWTEQQKNWWQVKLLKKLRIIHLYAFLS